MAAAFSRPLTQTSPPGSVQPKDSGHRNYPARTSQLFRLKSRLKLNEFKSQIVQVKEQTV